MANLATMSKTAPEPVAMVVKPVAANPLDLRTVQATERQAVAAEHANMYSEIGIVLAALQLLMTIIATVYLLRSFGQAKAALVQGEETLRRGQEDLQRQLRPYVHVFDARLVQFEVGKPIKIELKFTNTGQSPAVETQITRKITLGSTTDPIPLHLPKEYWSRYVLAANEVRKTASETGWSLTQDQYDALQVRETVYVLIHGAVTYSDTFGNAYITTFSLRNHDCPNEVPVELQARPWGNRMDHPDDLAKWAAVRDGWTSRAARLGDLQIPT